MVTANDNFGHTEVDDHILETGTDIDEQMTTLMNEPFVQRIKDFFSLSLERLKNQTDRKSQFLNLCRTFNQL